MIRASFHLPRSCADQASDTTQTTATSGGSESSRTSTPRPSTRPRTARVVAPTVVPDVRHVGERDDLTARLDRLGGHLHRVVPVIEGHH